MLTTETVFNKYMRPRIGKATKYDGALRACHEQLEADILELEGVIEHCLSSLGVVNQSDHDSEHCASFAITEKGQIML